MAGGYDGEIRIKTKIDNGDASSQLLQLEAKFQKTAREAARLEDEMRKLEQQKVPTEEYANLENKLKDAKFILEQYNDAIKNMPDKDQRWNELVDKEEEAYNEILRIKEALKQPIYLRPEGLYQQLDDTKKWLEILKKAKESVLSGEDPVLSRYKQEAEKATISIKKLEAEMLELDKAGKAFSSTRDPKTEAQYQKLSEKLRDANNQMNVLRRKMEEVAAKEAKVGSGAKQIEKVGKAAKKSAGLMSTFLSRLKGITLSLLVFNWISKGFNAMVAAFKDGIQNMAKYSADFNSKMSEMKSATATLKAALGALAAPIVSMVTPALSRLCDWLTRAINAMNQFIALLSGQSTWTRAKQQQVDYAKSLEKTSGAAKKAAGALASFDDLNVLSKSDSGGGGASSDLYEEVPTGDALSKKMQPFFDFLKKMRSEVIQGWDDAWERLDVEAHLANIKTSCTSIKNSLIGIFTSPEVSGAASGCASTIAYSIGQTAASIGSVGATIGENLLGGLSIYLESNGGRIKDFLIRMFDIGADVAQLAGEAADAFAYVFEAFGSEDGQQITANLIRIFTDVVESVTLLFAQFRDDLLHLLIDPFVNNSEGIRTALEGILEVVENVTGTISETVQHFTDGVVTLYDEHIHPLMQSLTDGLDELSEKFLEFWNTYVQPVLESLATKFHEVMEQHVQPMIDQFLNLIGSIVDALKALWEGVIVPFIGWIIENILPILIPIFQHLMEWFMSLFGFFTDIVSGIIREFKGIIDFLVGVFTGDWEKAWNGVSDIFSGVLKIITGFVQEKFTLIRTIIQTVLDAISGIVRTSIYTSRDTIKTVVNFIFNIIISFLNSINSKWTYIFTNLKDTAINIFNGIWNGIKGIINNIIGGIEKMVNGVIDGINAMIDSMNKLSWDIPDWVPKIGGNKFGISIPTIASVTIPRLANGGITTGRTLAEIGEAGREAVLPLENNTGWMDELAANIAERLPETGGSVDASLVLDGETCGRLFLPHLRNEEVRLGIAEG